MAGLAYSAVKVGIVYPGTVFSLPSYCYRCIDVLHSPSACQVSVPVHVRKDSRPSGHGVARRANGEEGSLPLGSGRGLGDASTRGVRRRM